MLSTEPTIVGTSGDSPKRAPLSVVVLNHNYARYVGRCIESILAQTYRDFTLTVLDDCSSDDSIEVITPFLADSRVTLVRHEQNRGAIESLIECAEQRPDAEIFVIISADDIVISRTAFEEQMVLFDRDPEMSFCYAAWQYLDASDGVRGLVRPWAEDHTWPGAQEFRAFCAHHYVLHSGTMVRRSAYRAVGGFDRSKRFTHDNALWALLCGVGSVGYLARPSYGYRVHGGNLSHSKSAAIQTIDEFIDLINDGFARLPETPEKHDRQLRQQALDAACLSAPTLLIFAGKRVSGWRALAHALRRNRRLVLNPRLLYLAMCTVTGERVYRALRRTVRQNLSRVSA